MKTALSTSTKLREKNIMIGELREVILRVNVLLINIFVKQIIKQLISYQYFKFQDNYYLSLKLRPRQSTTTTISSPPLPSTSRQPRKRSKTRSESQCYFRVFCNYKSKREAKSPLLVHRVCTNCSIWLNKVFLSLSILTNNFSCKHQVLYIFENGRLILI